MQPQKSTRDGKNMRISKEPEMEQKSGQHTSVLAAQYITIWLSANKSASIILLYREMTHFPHTQ